MQLSTYTIISTKVYINIFYVICKRDLIVLLVVKIKFSYLDKSDTNEKQCSQI